jgi:hypothetical protein
MFLAGKVEGLNVETHVHALRRFLCFRTVKYIPLQCTV